MKTTTHPSGTYSVVETAALLGFKRSTLYDNIKSGRADDLRPIRVGNTTRFPKAHIDRLLAGDAA